VGVTSRNLPFSGSDEIIRHFRQALSLDERRVKFKPNPWHIRAPSVEEAQRTGEGYLASRDFSAYQNQKTDVKEVWFSGCHTDVGGGSVLNTTEYSLANVTMRWMLNEIIAADTGILFTEDALRNSPAFDVLTVTATDPVPKNRSKLQDMGGSNATDETAYSTATAKRPPDGSQLTQRVGSDGKTIVSVQETSVEKDSTTPLVDALAGWTPYWILEYIPMRVRRQDAQGHWHKELYFNRGRPRHIEHPSPLFHSSVKLREAEVQGYKARATYTGTVTYVD